MNIHTVGCVLAGIAAPALDAIKRSGGRLRPEVCRRGEPPRPLWRVQGHQLPSDTGWHAPERLARVSRALGGERGVGDAMLLATTSCAVLTPGLRSQMAAGLTPPTSRQTSGSSAGDRVPPATPHLAAQLAQLIDSVPSEKRKRVLEQAGVVEVASSRDRVVDKTLTIASSLSVVHFYVGSDLISKLTDRVTKADKNTPIVSLDGACLLMTGFVVAVQAGLCIFWGLLFYHVFAGVGAGLASAACKYFNTTQG